MESEPERRTAVRLARIVRVRHMGYPGFQDHNVIAALWRTGGLRAFYEFVFDPGAA
jgi:hypothetical protein